jgi:hypothetical protein
MKDSLKVNLSGIIFFKDPLFNNICSIKFAEDSFYTLMFEFTDSFVRCYDLLSCLINAVPFLNSATK